MSNIVIMLRTPRQTPASSRACRHLQAPEFWIPPACFFPRNFARPNTGPNHAIGMLASLRLLLRHLPPLCFSAVLRASPLVGLAGASGERPERVPRLVLWAVGRWPQLRRCLGKNQVAPLSQDVHAGLLEQDSKGEQGGLVHAPLVDGSVPSDTARPEPGGRCRVEPAGIAVDGLQQVPLGKMTAPAVRKVLVGPVDVVFGVARRGVLASEQGLFGRQLGVPR